MFAPISNQADQFAREAWWHWLATLGLFLKGVIPLRTSVTLWVPHRLCHSCLYHHTVIDGDFQMQDGSGMILCLLGFVQRTCHIWCTPRELCSLIRSSFTRRLTRPFIHHTCEPKLAPDAHFYTPYDCATLGVKMQQLEQHPAATTSPCTTTSNTVERLTPCLYMQYTLARQTRVDQATLLHAVKLLPN